MNDQVLLLWGLALLAAALLLVIVEVFIPSGGLIAVVSALCAVAGIAFLFRYDLTWGLVGLVTMLTLGPITIGFALRVWPHTPLGRKMMGEKSPEQQEADRLAELRERERVLALVGVEGVALTDMRPVGVVRLEGQRMDALAETGFVRAGARVRVTRVEQNQIKVREIG